jgi:riboflavin kinase/FMN adenylyltransferase
MSMLTGKVVAGYGRGRSLGFPTANLDVEGNIEKIVESGVYAAMAVWEGSEREHPAVVNVGVRPTFSSGELAVEAHIIDFVGDLYGKTLRIRTVKKLRDERRFPNLDTLVGQLGRDVERARELIQSTELTAVKD